MLEHDKKKEQEIINSKEFIYHDGDPPHAILSLLVLSDALRQVGVVGQFVEQRGHHGRAVHLFLQVDKGMKDIQFNQKGNSFNTA